MNWHTAALPIIIMGVIVYHLAQKSIPRDANPFVALAAAYLIAFCLSVTALFISGDLRKGTEAFRYQEWLPVLLLGVTAVFIELGFLYAYRTGWKISTTGITVAAFTTSVLAVIGVAWFKEEITMLHAAGIALCLLGIVCINIK